MSKVCKKCGLEKPRSEWNRHSGRYGGLAVYCKTCMAEYNREWRARPDVKARQARLAAEKYAAMSTEERSTYIQTGVENRRATGYNLRSRYGITIEQYDEMLVSQDGGCAICGKAPDESRRLSVDHDHSCCPGAKTCGKCIRGLLCITCNVWLGYYENEEWISRARAYLDEGVTDD